MKLIIQIPCYNEEETLPIALSKLPRQIEGFEIVQWLIIDDGSTDNTVEVAKNNGVDHIIRHNKNHGLAKAFMTGLEACIRHQADVIVNTDADNQYNALDIPNLVKPILDKQAEVVVGAWPIDNIEHFSQIKKLLQKIGSGVIRIASNTDIPDAPSGFRAFTKEAAMRINIFNKYTYTLESIIQCGQSNMSITSVPVRVNEDLRPSRLLKSIPSYIKKSVITIIRIFVIYRPFLFFSSIGATFVTLGTLIGMRFLYFYSIGQGSGNIQSLILAAVFLISGFQTMLVAFLADMMAANRKMLEEIKYQSKAIRYNSNEQKESKINNV